MTVVEAPVVPTVRDHRIEAEVVATLADLDRPAWLKLRKHGLGGSDAAAVCGLDPYRSAFELYLEKRGELPGEKEATEPMLWGQILEPVVADEFQRRSGVELEPAKYMFRHPDHPFLFANPDRFLFDDTESEPGILEVKTTNEWEEDAWQDGPAERALIQWQHYAGVLGIRWGWIACLIAGQRYVAHRVERDDELVAMLFNEEALFWQRVCDGDPPPVTGRPSDSDLLQKLWNPITGKEVLVGDEAVELVARYQAAHAAVKAAEEAKTLAGNEMKLLLGDGEVALNQVGEKVFSWKLTDSRQLNKERFKTEMPRFAATFVENQPSRRLWVPAAKKKKG